MRLQHAGTATAGNIDSYGNDNNDVETITTMITI